MKMLVSMLTLAALALGACSQPPGTSGQAGQPDTPARSAPKTLVMAINEDPRNFWDGVNGGGGSGSREIGHMVNQYLANILPDGQAVPRLLAEMPSADKGTWTVFPDGRMEVTYRVHPGVRWHDGTPFTADDIVFSWEVCRDPGVPNGNQSTVRLIDSVMAVDPMTAVASYSQTYPFADRLEHREFFPLPKHLLETAYRESKETLIAQPYFTDAYVGVGPFKLATWEHGSHMDLVANDDYFLGRPKIDRARIQFISDTNTGVATIQAGSLNAFLPPGGPDWDQVQPLRQEWQGNSKGEVVLERVRWQFAEPQKGAIAQPADLRDVRVRQALLMAMNREELTRTLQGDLGGVAYSWVHPSFPYYPQVKDAIVEYPFDPRRATALLADVGWTPGPDGILQKGGQKFTLVVRPQEAQEKSASIMQQDWKAIGIDAQLEVLSNVLLRDAEARATFTGVALNGNPMGGLSAVRRFATDQIPSAANRFAGTNRGQFSNAQWDDVGLRLRTALDDDRRLQLERELLQIFSAELPVLTYQYELQGIPITGFKGFKGVTGTTHTGNIMHTTTVHEWEML
jgi:peptide/nickel transport system substrate-binding protein